MQPKSEKLKNINFHSIVLLTISLAFYLFFAFFDGAVICVDSPSYIGMEIRREPLYPLFLAFFRAVFTGFGPDFYLTAAVFAQSILAAFAAWSLTAFLSKEFQLNKLFSLFVLFMPFSVSLLCRFAARRSSMYSNSILTEGITISFYLLFFRYLFEYILRQSRKSLLSCCILVFILISTRKQMLFSFALLIICILTVFIRRKQFTRGASTAFLCTICIFLCNIFFDMGYNYVLRGEFTRHTSDTRFITTMAFYTARREDAQYIEDASIRNLFSEIYDICDNNNYLKNSAGRGWLNRVSHFGDCYDCIQIDTMYPHISEFVKEHYGDNIVNLNENSDKIMNVINVSVLPHNILKAAGSFADNFLSGLITTVAQRTPVLIWYSLAIYSLYMLLLIYHAYIVKNNKIVLFALLTLLSIILNVGLVSMVIFCQTRYTIYNMALFYISLLLMVYEPLRNLMKGSAHAV